MTVNGSAKAGLGHGIRAACAAAVLGLPCATAAAQTVPPPWQRTETRAACSNFAPLRQPFFGETHVHTGLSVDAVIMDTRTEPRDAYKFATGQPIGLAPYDSNGAPTRSTQLRRPLDFTAVTDHAEGFGVENICLDLAGNPNVPLVDNPSLPPATPSVPPTMAGYNSTECASLRSDPGRWVPGYIPNTFWNILLPTVLSYPAQTLPMCANGTDIPNNTDNSYCEMRSSVIWQAEQDAAEEFYDRTAACSFTTFVGYEWTGMPHVTGLGNNLHRNVIFRNAKVPVLPISYLDQSTAEGLWGALQTQCLDGTNVISSADGTLCDVLAIPHNSNMSGGLMFEADTNVAGNGGTTGSPVAYTAADAATQKAFEPLVEMFQHKGDSECRPGVDTVDELCGFEKVNRTHLFSQTLPKQTFPSLSFVRNGLKEGLRQEQQLGVNPYQMGFVGGTDSHNATPSQVDEDNWQGHVGTQDGSDVNRLSWNQNIEHNPGGLTVVWAEENSRDALFAAMRRREVYATSGIRPVVRMFAGAFSPKLCSDPNFLATAYAKGAPMGAEIGALAGPSSPKFAVMAIKDQGGNGAPSTQLQRIQIVKGWIDDSGSPQEQVFDVAGDPNNGAGVDLTTCTPQGPGFDALCTVWKDPGFKSRQRAFYYARVLENPTCRWSTQLCNANHIDCTTTPPPGFEACCGGICQSGTTTGNNSGAACTTDSDCVTGVSGIQGTCQSYPKTIQERAWTSPVWYRPEAIGKVQAKITYGLAPGTDVLKLSAKILKVPATVDPNTQDLVLTLQDDDTIYTVTVPKGTMTPPKTAPGLFVYKDATGSLGGITKLAFSTKSGALTLTTLPMSLAHADRVSHVLEFHLSAGTYQTAHARRWTYKANKNGTGTLSTS